MENLDLKLILNILEEYYITYVNQGYPCTRIKKEIEKIKKLLTK